MKKVLAFLSLLFLFSTITAQQINDTSTLRSVINSQIVPNSNRAITALTLNRILNGYLNTRIIPYSWALQPSKPVYSWSELTGKPILFDGDYNSLINKPVINYDSITSVPTNWLDIIDKPIFNIDNWNTAYSWGNHSGLYRPISYVPSWSEITSKPTFFSGNYSDLIGSPTLNITNWNTAYSWGNHAGLYRPLSYVPAWSEIIGKPTLDITNWNTAYSWGNHAGLYRPSSYVPAWSEITGKPTLDITNWNTAYSWGNHAGLYRPISYVPSWSEITSKPSFDYFPNTGGSISGNITLNNGQYYQAKRNTFSSVVNVLGFEYGTDDLIQVFSNNWKLRNTGTGDIANVLVATDDKKLLVAGATDDGSSYLNVNGQIKSNSNLILGNGYLDMGYNQNLVFGANPYRFKINRSSSGLLPVYFDDEYDHIQSSVRFRMRTSGTPIEALTILGSGNIGINNTNPINAKLEVVSNSGEVFRADAASGAMRIVADQTGVHLNGITDIGNPYYKIDPLNVYNTAFFVDSKTQWFRIGMKEDKAILHTDWYSGFGGSQPDIVLKSGSIEGLIIKNNGDANFYNKVTATNLQINSIVTDGSSKLETSGNVRNVGNNTASQMVHGSWYPNMSTHSGSITLPATSTTYLYKETSNVTWTLETAYGHNRYYIIRAADIGNVTIALQSGQYIMKKDGSNVTTLTATLSGGAIHLQSDGVSKWYEL